MEVDRQAFRVLDGFRPVPSGESGVTRGRTIDFLLSTPRNAGSAKRLFRTALAQPHAVDPRTITMDKNPAMIRKRRLAAPGGVTCRRRLPSSPSLLKAA